MVMDATNEKLLVEKPLLTSMDWGWQAKVIKLRDRMQMLFQNQQTSDVSFRVGLTDESAIVICAHKFLLATASSVFEAMFFGCLPEKAGIIRIPDVEASAFHNVLRYIYTEDPELNLENVMGTVYAARKYGLPGLMKMCVEFIKPLFGVTPANAIRKLTEAIALDLLDLATFCMESIEEDAHAAFQDGLPYGMPYVGGVLVLEENSFLFAPQTTMLMIAQNDDLSLMEIFFYYFMERWANENCVSNGIEPTGQNKRAALGDIFDNIRFSNMFVEDVANGPIKDGMLEPNECVELYTQLLKGSNITTKFCLPDRLRKRSFKERIASKISCRSPETPYPDFGERQLAENSQQMFLRIGFGSKKAVRLAGVRLSCRIDGDVSVYFAVRHRVLPHLHSTVVHAGNGDLFFKYPVPLQPCSRCDIVIQLITGDLTHQYMALPEDIITFVNRVDDNVKYFFDTKYSIYDSADEITGFELKIRGILLASD